MDKAESIRRLTVLRDFLKNNVKEQTFDIKKWECGSVKCAVGWACYIPEFKKLGLGIRSNYYGSYPYLKNLDGSYSYSYKNVDPWYAVQEFFGLELYWARYMFDPSKYPINPTLHDVCNRIDTTIKAGLS